MTESLHEYTFPCPIGQGIENYGAVARLIRRIMDRCGREGARVRELAFGRAHAILRCLRPLTPDEVEHFKAAFADFRAHADDLRGEVEETLCAMSQPALSEDDARELAWLRDLYGRAHLKPDLLSNTTGTRWAIAPLEDVRGGQPSAEVTLPPPPRLSSGPGDSIGFDSGLLVPVSPAEVEAMSSDIAAAADPPGSIEPLPDGTIVAKLPRMEPMGEIVVPAEPGNYDIVQTGTSELVVKPRGKGKRS